jgi:glycosyltransferase involved in cell wall biosynthesis
MTISFILAVYNGAATLRGCLDHLLSQRYTNWEGIAVNDGSGDESAAILAEYARRDLRLKVLHHDHNQGVAAARNTGLKAARGEFALLLDQDDHLLPDSVGRLVGRFRQFPHAAALAGSCILVSPQRRVSCELIGPEYDITFAEFCKNNYVMTPAVLMRRMLVQEVGGLQLGLEGCDDWDLWGRLTRTGCSIRRCNVTVSEYRIHSGNNSRQALRQFRTSVQVLERMYAADSRVPACEPRWREGGKPEDKTEACLLLMWANAAMPLLAGDIEGAVAVVEHAQSVLPSHALRPETAALLHDGILLPSLFAGIDPKCYIPQARPLWQTFFARLEALLQRVGFAEAAMAALTDRCLLALTQENEMLAAQVERYRTSRSFRLGRLLTKPLHWFRQFRHALADNGSAPST